MKVLYHFIHKTDIMRVKYPLKIINRGNVLLYQKRSEVKCQSCPFTCKGPYSYTYASHTKVL